MDTTEQQFDEILYNTLVESTPEVVRSFILGDTFSEIIKSIGGKYSLSEPQQHQLEVMIIDSLMGEHVSQEDMSNLLTSFNLTEPQQWALLSDIQHYIVEYVSLSLDYNDAITSVVDENATEEENSNVDKTTATTITVPLSVIQQKLSGTVVTPPETRNHSLERATVDPYREKI